MLYLRQVSSFSKTRTVREEMVCFDAFTLRFFERNKDCDSEMAKLLEATKLYIQDCRAQEEKVTKHLA